jgi:hypothetical protein
MAVLRDKVISSASHIGKVTAAASGNSDFLASGFGVVDDNGACPGLGGTHQSGGTGTYDQGLGLHGFPWPTAA